MSNKIRIGDLCELKYGKALKAEDRIHGNYPVFGSSGIVGYHNEFLTDKPTLIIGRKGSVGEVYYCEKPSWTIDTAYYVEYDPARLELKWFKSVLKSLNLKRLDKSAAVPGLNRNDIYNLSIFLPTLEDQIYISNILSKAEALINQREDSLRLLDEFLKSTFLEMFGDPVRNESNWKQENLENICLKIADIDHKMPKAVDEGYPFVSAKDLLDNGTISFKDVKKISKEDFLQLSKKIKPQKGDIIYSRIGAKLGKARIVDVDFEFVASYSCCTIRPNPEKINTVFLTKLLDSPYLLKQALKDVRAIGVPDLGMDKIRKFKIILPDTKLQDKFAQIVYKAESLKAQNQISLRELENLYASLSQRAFKGELVQNKPNEVYKPKNIYFYQTQVLAFINNASKQKNIQHGEMTLAKYLYLVDKLYGVPTYFNYERLHLGPYPKEIKKVINNKKHFKIGKGNIEILNQNILFKYNNPFKEKIIAAIEELSDIFSKYTTNERAHQTELLATVCKVIEDIKSTDLKAIRASMKEWPIDLKTSKFKNKSEKFSEIETLNCLESIKEFGWLNQILRR